MDSRLKCNGWTRLTVLRTGGVGVPPTIIELLYEDVTAKAKSIVLSTKFGPYCEGGIKFVEDQLAKQGDDLTACRATLARIMGANDPKRSQSPRLRRAVLIAAPLRRWPQQG